MNRRGFALAALLVVVPSLTTAQERVFFGNLHSHTSYSDGSGTPSQAYRHARDVAHLDFLAITEHNHSRAESGARERRDGLLIATNHALYTGPDAEALIPAANRLTEDGQFVAIYGQEFSTISSGNHVNVFNVDAVIDAPNGDFAGLVTWLQAHLDAQGHAPIVELNHPADFDDASKEYGIDDFGSTASWLATFGPYVQLIELLNGPGLDPTDGHPPRSVMQADYLDYLNRGFHVAPAGDQDNHYRTWGTLTDARTAVIALALTRAAVLDALRNRHVYATEDRNLELIAKVDGHLMGDIVTPPAVGAALAITLAIRDADEPDAAYRVEVFVDAAPGGPVAQSVETFTFTGDSPAAQPYALEGVRFQNAGQYLFLKVTQLSEHGDADRAWTAPLWFEPGGGGPPTSAAGKVRITSVLANPAGDERQNETVTLKNTGAASVNLSGWTLRDEAGTTWSLSSLGTLAAGASKTIHRNAQAMSLNNGGDTIVLLDPSGAIVQSVTYPAMAEGQTFTPP